jgi:hypothetical protein
MQSESLKRYFVFMLLMLILPTAAFAQQEKPAYGRAGMWELGGNVMGIYNRYDDSITLSGTSAENMANAFDIDVAAFLKYFLFEHFHIGVKLSYQTLLSYDRGVPTDASHNLSLTLSPGYTLAISPLFQIDLSLFGGGRADFVVRPSFYLIFAPLAGGEVMLLFPVIESVVIGFGYNFTVLFWPQQSIIDYDESLGYRNGTMQGLSLEHGAKFQVSFYF